MAAVRAARLVDTVKAAAAAAAPPPPGCVCLCTRTRSQARHADWGAVGGCRWSWVFCRRACRWMLGMVAHGSPWQRASACQPACVAAYPPFQCPGPDCRNPKGHKHAPWGLDWAPGRQTNGPAGGSGCRLACAAGAETAPRAAPRPTSCRCQTCACLHKQRPGGGGAGEGAHERGVSSKAEAAGDPARLARRAQARGLFCLLPAAASPVPFPQLTCPHED